MKDDIMVSVCCMTYNHGSYIRDALEGFVKQKTTFCYEVLINDDASTDDTPRIIMEYAEKYPDIIKPILQIENQYSKGIDLYQTVMMPKVRGKYTAHCEGDDYWIDEYKLQKQIDYLEQHSDCVMCVHNTIIRNCQTGKETLMNSSIKEYDISMEDIIEWSKKSYHTSSTVGYLNIMMNLPDFYWNYKKQQENGDYPFGIYLRTCGKIHYIPDVMSVYRYGVEGSFTKRIRNNKQKIIGNLQSQIELLKEINDYTNKEYEESIKFRILVLEFEMAKMRGDFRGLLNSKYKKVIQQLPLKSKVAFIAGVISPNLYNFMLRISLRDD